MPSKRKAGVNMAKKQTYEEAMKRLSEIVEKLENAETTLDESVALFEEGTKLSAFCYDTLKNAEQKISQLSFSEEDQ